jgi:cysteine-rich repeat protein
VDGDVSYCGDSNVDDTNGEQCDDGNSDNTDTCSNLCTPPSCGNGQIDGADECDEGGSNSDTGACKANCTEAECGDGHTWAGHEDCDDGNTDTEACSYGQTSCTVCDASCNDAVGATSYCGDSAIDSGNGEECDDGNQDDTDLCTNTCLDGCPIVVTIDAVDPPASCTSHAHALSVPLTDVVAGVAKTYTLSSQSGHTHDVTVSSANFTTLKNGTTVDLTSTGRSGSCSNHTHPVHLTRPDCH